MDAPAIKAPASTARPITLTMIPEVRKSQREIGRESNRSIVPRSTSAATAAEPRPIAQTEISRKIKGWLHDARINDSDDDSASIPIIFKIWTLPSAPSSPKSRKILDSFSDVTQTNSQPRPKRTADESPSVHLDS